MIFSHPAILFPPYTGPKPNATDTFVATTSNQVDGTVFTFVDLAIGIAAAKRKVILCIGMRNKANSTAPVISGVTIDGNAMTLARQKGRTAGGEPNPGSGLYYLAWPTGTLATFVVTFATTQLQCGVMTHRLMNAAATPYATKADTSGSSGLNLNVNVEAGGTIVATACQKPAGTQGFSGITEDSEMDFGTSTMISGHQDKAAAATPDVNNGSGNGNDDTGVSVAWSKEA